MYSVQNAILEHSAGLSVGGEGINKEESQRIPLHSQAQVKIFSRFKDEGSC